MTFIFRNGTIFSDIPKWNRGQTKWDEGSNKVNKTINDVPLKSLTFQTGQTKWDGGSTKKCSGTYE